MISITSSPEIFPFNTSVPVEGHPLHFQERFFHLQSTPESAQRPVAPDRPVAGNDQGKGIPGQGCSHRSACPGIAQPVSQPAIAYDLSPWNPEFLSENFLLKGAAETQVQTSQIKYYGFTGKISAELVDDRIDQGMRPQC